jgi:hypothetical protein
VEHRGSDLLVQRLDVDAPGRGLDPDLAAVDHPVQTVLVPEVREIGAEDAEALGRQLEVERLRHRQSRHGATVRSSRVFVPGTGEPAGGTATVFA